jgi:tetratricopeptide (TPR) repeat protein
MGRRAEARADLDAALRFNPSDVDVLYARGTLNEQEAQYARALADFSAGLRRQPNHLGCLSGRAWLLATCPQEDYRNGEQALADAQKACDLTDWLNPALLATLAAAHAECAEFDAAITWERRALRLAGAAPSNRISPRLSFYEAGLSYGAPPR